MDVRIFKPHRSPMQSAQANTAQWVLEYELKTPRHPEPLMGWTSSEDTLNQVRLRFPSRDEAVVFAQKNGWNYTVFEPHKRRIPPKNYIDNFRDRERRNT